jgi:hypothetical protein
MVFYFYTPRRPGIRAILSMSAKEPGRYQITYFVFSQKTSMFIPWSDSIRDSIRDCLRQLDDEGYHREKRKRFDMFEQPNTFVPTRRPGMTRSDKQTERLMKEFGHELADAI